MQHTGSYTCAIETITLRVGRNDCEPGSARAQWTHHFHSSRTDRHSPVDNYTNHEYGWRNARDCALCDLTLFSSDGNQCSDRVFSYGVLANASAIDAQFVAAAEIH